MDPISFVHTLYLEGHKYSSTFYNCGSYQQFPYENHGKTITHFGGEWNIPIF